MTKSSAQPKQCPLTPTYKSVCRDDSVSVVVTSHNYGHYLQQCLDSLLSQTVLPFEVYVVCDSCDSSDTSAKVCEQNGIKYTSVEHRSAFLSRQIGFEYTRAPFVIFLDADDYLADNYIETCLESFDSLTGIVTTPLSMFGLKEGILDHRPTNIQATNWIHAGSMVRRTAIDATEVYCKNYKVSLESHEDWFVWKRVVALGWKVNKARDTLYYYRQHSKSMMAGDMRLGPYIKRAGLDFEDFTLVIPLCRARYWPRLSDWIKSNLSDFNHIMVIDSSGDNALGLEVSRFLADTQKSHTYIKRAGNDDLADVNRKNNADIYLKVQVTMPRIYKHLRLVPTEYMLIVEDDVLPPDGSLGTLLQSMERNVAAVSGTLRSRFCEIPGTKTGRVIAGDTFDKHIAVEKLSGIQEVAYTGFGCLLLRKSILDLSPPFNSADSGNYDVELCKHVMKLGYRWLLDWSVRCVHADIIA